MKNLKKDRLSELYSVIFESMLEFRKNNTKLFFGVSGIILAILGWIFIRENSLELNQQILISVGLGVIIIIYLVLSRSTHHHFLQAATILNKIDEIYGFYEKGKYIKDDTLLPEEWECFGTKEWKEPM